MQPDATPERDTARQEAKLARSMHPNLPPRDWQTLVVDTAIIILGFLLAFGLALLVMLP